MKTDFAALLLDESPDAVIATTAEGKVLYWSKGAEAVFGFMSAEAVGREIYEIIVPAEYRSEDRRSVDEALRTGFTTYESVRTHKDGSPVYVDTSCKAVRDAAAKNTGT